MGSKGLTGGCAALVLAAGRGRRFGSDKRVAVLPSGKRLLETTLGLALQAFEEVWVVVRPEDDVETLGVDVGRVKVVRSELADEGMGQSLAAGVRAIEESASVVDAVAVMLGDMPWVEVGTLVTLRDLAERSRIVVPECGGGPGHPVVFGEEFWGELMRLEGDRGGKRVIEQNLDKHILVTIEDTGVLSDLDTAKSNTYKT